MTEREQLLVDKLLEARALLMAYEEDLREMKKQVGLMQEALMAARNTSSLWMAEARRLQKVIDKVAEEAEIDAGRRTRPDCHTSRGVACNDKAGW